MENLTIIEEERLTDVGYQFIWVIRPLHIVGIPKVSCGIKSMFLPAMRYSKVRGTRRHLGDWGDGPGIYGHWYSSVSTLLTHWKIFRLTKILGLLMRHSNVSF